MNPFRRNPEDGAIGVLQSRSTLYKNGPHYKAATRNPAWIKVTGTANSCMGGDSITLPKDEDTFNKVYNPAGRLKLGPILKDVVIEYGGEFGLTQTISITIECYTLEDFKQIELAFLLPGNKISAKFGYGKSWNEGDQQSLNAGPFRVVTFNFSTTSEGYWVASCKAVAAAEAVKDIEVSSIIKDKGLKYKGGNKKYPVIGMAELIAYDAQKNGEKAIDEMQDGETVTPPGGGAIVVYSGKHLYSTAAGSWINQMINKFDFKSEAEQTFNVVYLTLEYVIKRLLMGQIKEEIGTAVIDRDKSDFDKLKIVFDDNISISWVDYQLRSGSPLTCLLLGNGMGNYKNGTGDGKNFETDCKNLSKVTAMSSKESSRQKVIHKNILLERSIIVKAFTEASKTRQATSDSVDVKDTKDMVLPIEDFLKKIFDHIGICTGGAMQLRLAVHPKNTNTLVVIDQNNGKAPDPLKVVILNPIDGDGSTRSCTIQSNVGSEEYKAGMFAGPSRKGDGPASVRGCKEQVDNKKASTTHKDAVKSIGELLYTPGTLGANQFGAVQENALLGAIGTLAKSTPSSKKYEIIPYLGMSIEAELDGVFGFLPGNGITTTQLTPHYKKNNNYFMLRAVTHTFNGQESSWTTKLSGIMTFYEDIEWKDL